MNENKAESEPRDNEVNEVAELISSFPPKCRGRKPKFGSLAYYKRHNPELLNANFKDTSINILAMSKSSYENEKNTLTQTCDESAKNVQNSFTSSMISSNSNCSSSSKIIIEKVSNVSNKRTEREDEIEENNHKKTRNELASFSNEADDLIESYQTRKSTRSASQQISYKENEDEEEIVVTKKPKSCWKRTHDDEENTASENSQAAKLTNKIVDFKQINPPAKKIQSNDEINAKKTLSIAKSFYDNFKEDMNAKLSLDLKNLVEAIGTLIKINTKQDTSSCQQQLSNTMEVDETTSIDRPVYNRRPLSNLINVAANVTSQASNQTVKRRVISYIEQPRINFIRNSSCSASNFAVNLLIEIFDSDELNNRDFNLFGRLARGVCGVQTKPLDPSRIQYIRNIVDGYFVGSEDEKLKRWRLCCKAMNKKITELRLKKKN